jgi:spore coat protein CotH
LLLDFNKYVTNQQFHGMKRLVLDNQIQDNTFLKEPLSYVVFEAMGIASPQISYARVTVNDEYWGVYWLIENIGKDFLRARFGEDAGNLYEYDYLDDWRFTVRGDGTQRAYVPGPFKPETNEDNNDSTPLARFVDHANSASTTGFGATMGQYIDVNKWLTHVAVENALAGSDGVVGQQGMNNFYLYQFSNNGKFVLIPWDQDTTFVSATWPIEFGLDTNVLIRKLVADPALKQVYIEAVKRTAATALNPGVLLPKIEAYYTLIREAVLSDTKKPFSNEEFEQGVQGMRGMVAARPADINAQ